MAAVQAGTIARVKAEGYLAVPQPVLKVPHAVPPAPPDLHPFPVGPRGLSDTQIIYLSLRPPKTISTSVFRH